jgi:hypothetical protein
MYQGWELLCQIGLQAFLHRQHKVCVCRTNLEIQSHYALQVFHVAGGSQALLNRG